MKELPKDLVCPQCETILNYGVDLQNSKKQTKKGDIFLCSNCGAASRVGDSNLVRMTRDDIGKLDTLTQANLVRAATAIQMQRAKMN